MIEKIYQSGKETVLNMKNLVFDIGGTAIKYGICENDKLLQVNEIPTNAFMGGRHVMDTLTGLIRSIAGNTECDAIGISTAGQVDSSKGSIIYANSNLPDYTGTQIRQELENIFHLPVAVENDVNSAAIGEAAYGAGQEYSDFLCLTYGTGVGGAIIHNKQIYHGSSFSAGEFGAIVTHGAAKTFGSDFFDGCYERYASTAALINSASAFNPSLTDGKKIFARIGDEEIKAVVDCWITEILFGLTTLIHIFNPSCIILGGGVMEQPYIIEQIKDKLGQSIMPSFAHVEIKPAALGNNAGLLGANYLASQYKIQCGNKEI